MLPIDPYSHAFTQGKLMTSWAVVCDVYFLEPQTKRPDETAQQFAERVQKMIAERAKLTVAPWDGYLKYYTLGVKVKFHIIGLPDLSQHYEFVLKV